MEDELISFETAKLAKEKGFDEKVRAVFRVWHEVAQERKYHNRAYNYNGANWDGDKDQFYSRPTQSLLQKWLREEHNIDFVIIPYPRGYEFMIFNNSEESTRYRYSGYTTYEEALEASLFEALKTFI